MIPAIADKGSLIDNTPFLIFLALIGAAVGARWLANHIYDRRRAVEEAMRRHPAGKALEVDDLQAEWDAYFDALEDRR